jgi:protein gp37
MQHNPAFNYERPVCNHADSITCNKYADIAAWDGTLAEFPARWAEPLRWRKPQRVFVGSRSDVALWGIPDLQTMARIIQDTPHHRYLLLTKRPAVLTAKWSGLPPPNVWLGVTVCNHAEMYKLRNLMQMPAAGYWISLEPQIGGAVLPEWSLGRLGWVVQGGESGPGARPFDADWARSMRDQCAAAGVAYWFKQWGDNPVCRPYDAGEEPYRGLWHVGREPHELPHALRLPGEE